MFKKKPTQGVRGAIAFLLVRALFVPHKPRLSVRNSLFYIILGITSRRLRSA